MNTVNINKIPKSVIFAVVAAVGCFVAALIAEPLLALFTLSPAPPPVLQSEPPKPVRLQITQPNWDDTAKILDAMELTYTHFAGEIDCDIFFLNCGSTDTNRIRANQLREFVSNGGIFYASCRAAGLVEEAFPGLITFKNNPHIGNTIAEVVDSELKDVAGERITIYFDLPDGMTVDSISRGGDIILRTAQSPIMVACPYGDGKVFFTSFHNHVQTSEREAALLKLFIMKQISAFRNTSVEDVSKELNIDLANYRRLFLIGSSDSSTPDSFTTSDTTSEVTQKLGTKTIVRPPLHIFLMLCSQVVVWSGLLCFGMLTFLVASQNHILRKPMITGDQLKVLGIASVVAGVLAGGTGQVFFIYLNQAQFLGRLVGWALLGAILALGMSFYIANLDRKWALIGGAFGGTLGAIGFAISTQIAGQTSGRLLGAAILGACIGAMIGFVEQFYRNVWLMVIYDPRNFAQVNLGSQAVTVGSGSNDTVPIHGVGAKAGTFLVVGDQIQYTDTYGTQSLSPGDRVNVGGVELVICSNDVQFAPSKFYPMKMSRARELMNK